MEHELIALARSEKTSSNKHHLRKSGMVPAVVYGKNVGNVAIAVDAVQIKKIINESGSNALISMKVKENGKTKKYKVLIKAIQRDPVRRDLIHIDFHQVSVKDRVHATVPVHLEGTPAGVLVGGTLAHLARRVEVECLADRIPDSLVVDISGLEIGDTLTMADLKLPEGVKILEEPAAPVVTVTAAERPEAEAEVPAPEEPGAEGSKEL
ncbi:MAG: 50S ribosomal protein L25 [Pelotomaculaceae bacterium]|jgi:large subunit ribosomal protein L25|uniref:50S ribosomal protein L25 n=1 Tax=anaerobic digester metagenome TaxID=1263854 RepID=A0A485M1P3_9ZZZZ|nr:50S ribosomal protein L25 [Bacillota bacterium]HHU85360.1 50S ribosomal protein L25 [Peptococcaceae bacterium]